jgi:hypothetical protein
MKQHFLQPIVKQTNNQTIIMYERIALLFMILAMLHGRPFFASLNLCKGANKINKKEKAKPGGTIPSQYRALKVLKCNNAACVRDYVSVPLIQISHHSRSTRWSLLCKLRQTAR